MPEGKENNIIMWKLRKQTGCNQRGVTTMNLLKIAPNVQNISEAIASVLKVDVTVVDNKMIRISGTGSYRDKIGETVSRKSVFGESLIKGKSYIIENAGKHQVCLNCDYAQTCKEYAEVCCPIKVNDQVMGVIGLIAFEERQRDEILQNKNNLMTFLNKMADLISSKLIEQHSTDKIKLLAKELEIVLDSVDKGILAVDHGGNIIRYNKKIAEIFKISEEDILNKSIGDFVPDLEISSLVKSKFKIKNREFTYRNKKHHLRGVFDTNPINIDGESFGLVFTFSKLSDVLNVVNDMTTGNIITGFNEIIGNSLLINKVKLEARNASQTTSTVLIQGESGTGKELFARAIHFASERRKAPFIPINCAAIPEQLLESELFGYEEGAFTGARRGGRAGKFLLADKGTIFLDEIGDMPLHLQTKLLRVLQEQEIEKIGGKDLIPIDIRVITATNKDLEKKVQDGEFREDLFYRINVIPLQIPPLRWRKEDIIILVKYLLDKCNKKLNKYIKDIDPKVLDLFMDYDWPGNVRELENTLEYSVNMCDGEIIRLIHLPKRLINRRSETQSNSKEEIIPIKELEKREIKKAINHLAGKKQSMNLAASLLGMSRATLYRKMKEYDL